MTARWLTERDVVGAVDLPEAVVAVREALRAEAAGGASVLPKTATVWGDGHTLHALGGVLLADGLAGTKTWAHSAEGASPLLVLWDSGSGAVRAIVEAFALGQLRTAAVSAVATDALAARDASVLAMIGTGRQALAQVAAVASQRQIQEVRVFSPTPAHRARFRAQVAAAMPGAAVVDCDAAATATAGADVVTSATRARTPVLDDGMLGARAHLNALGAITPERRELTDALVRNATLVVSDVPSAARRMSTEVAAAHDVVALSQVLEGGSRPAVGLTVFKAMGIGLADVAIGAAVLRRTEEQGAGRPIPRPERAAARLSFAPVPAEAS